jgi:hypothetical protein
MLTRALSVVPFGRSPVSEMDGHGDPAVVMVKVKGVPMIVTLIGQEQASGSTILRG